MWKNKGEGHSRGLTNSKAARRWWSLFQVPKGKMNQEVWSHTSVYERERDPAHHSVSTHGKTRTRSHLRVGTLSAEQEQRGSLARAEHPQNPRCTDGEGQDEDARFITALKFSAMQ